MVGSWVKGTCRRIFSRRVTGSNSVLGSTFWKEFGDAKAENKLCRLVAAVAVFSTEKTSA